jgi:hypothetical protein
MRLRALWGSWKNQADGGGSGDVAGGPVRGWGGVAEPDSVEIHGGALLPTAIAERNVARTQRVSG